MWYVFSLITWIKCKDYIKVIWIVAVKISQTQFYQRQKPSSMDVRLGSFMTWASGDIIDAALIWLHLSCRIRNVKLLHNFQFGSDEKSKV